MKTKFLGAAIAVGISILAIADSAFAVPVVFSGYDSGAGSLGASPNATAAAAAFDAAAPGDFVIDFESPLPGGVTITPGSITNNSGCINALCGYNTTTAGSNFYLTFGGTHTFTFATPIDSFGAYFTGWQVGSQTLSYTNGGSVVLNMPAADINLGGTAFFGFVDPGASITSITYNAVNDIVAVDDVRFGSVAVPEPGTLGIMGLGLAGLGFVRRRKAA